MPTNGPPAECTVRLTVRVMTGAWLWLCTGPPSPHWSHLSLVGGQPLPHTATRLSLTVNILSLIPHQHIQSLTVTTIQPHTSHAHTISHNYSASYLTSTTFFKLFKLFKLFKMFKLFKLFKMCRIEMLIKYVLAMIKWTVPVSGGAPKVLPAAHRAGAIWKFFN